MAEQLNYYEDNLRTATLAPRVGKLTVLEALAEDTKDLSINLSNASTRNSGADLDDQ